MAMLCVMFPIVLYNGDGTDQKPQILWRSLSLDLTVMTNPCLYKYLNQPLLDYISPNSGEVLNWIQICN